MTFTSALVSSNDDTWNTSEEDMVPVRRAFGTIGLDPCSNATSIVRARREYRLDRGEDGLVLPWCGFGLVYLNAPFSLAEEFMARCTEADELVALMPTRSETAWWQRGLQECDAIVLPKGRRYFTRGGEKARNAPFPSTWFYFGPRADAFMWEFAPLGLGFFRSSLILRRSA